MGKLKDKYDRLMRQVRDIEAEARSLLDKAGATEAKAKKIEEQFHTPLQAALRANKRNEALDLIKSGSDPNAVGAENATPPLCMAIDRHEKQIALALLRAGADPSATYGTHEGPALQMAIRRNLWPLAIALLKAGADPTIEISGVNLEEKVTATKESWWNLRYRDPQKKMLEDMDRFLALLPEARRKFDRKSIDLVSAEGKPGKKREGL